MLFPYSTDLHDGKIGIVSLSIIIVCLLVHIIVWTHDNAIKQDLYQAMIEAQALDTKSKANQFKLQLLSLDDDNSFDEYMQEQYDSLKARVDKLKNSLWMVKLSFIPSQKNPFQILTAMFTHEGWMHLIGNMLFFYVCGVALEKYWGTTRFTLFYLLSGIGASLFYLLYAQLFIPGDAWEKVSCVGASGAISGTIGALLVKHPKNKVFIFYWLWRKMGTFMLPVYAYFGFWTFEQILYIFTDSNMKGGVAFSAHIGGLLTGVIFAFFLKSNEISFVNDTSSIKQGAKKFVVIGADDTIKSTREIPQIAPLSHQMSLIEKGWDALGKNNLQDASQLISSGIEQLFLNPSHNRLEIEQNVKRFLAAAQSMPINSNMVYEWGKKLQSIDLPVLAIYCYDLAMKTTQNNHLMLNGILSASQLRLKQQFQTDHAIKTLQYIISKYPQSMHAQEAQKIITYFSH